MAARARSLALALALAATVRAAEIESPIALRLPSETAGNTYTYSSVDDPTALNLDGSIYGIAYCLSPTSKANWSFSADGGCVRARRCRDCPLFSGLSPLSLSPL